MNTNIYKSSIMNKLFLRTAMTLLLALTTLTASAEVGDVLATGNCGTNISWTLTENSDKVYKTSQVYPGLTQTVTGTGAMTNYAYNSTRWGGNTVKTVSLPSELTTIGNITFDGCSSLETIDIPAMLLKIDGLVERIKRSCRV